MKKIALISSSLFALPLFASAQYGSLAPVQQFIVSIGNIVALLIPIMIGLAMLYFFYGLIQYIKKPESKEGTKTMIAGIISLFIMVSIWGIVRLVQSAVLGGTNPSTTIGAPHFPTN